MRRSPGSSATTWAMAISAGRRSHQSEPRREKLRWRLFDGRTASLEHARDILARRFNVHLSTSSRMLVDSTHLATTNSAFIQVSAICSKSILAPRKSCRSLRWWRNRHCAVVGAFLAGLVDSDGYVEASRDRVTVTTQSQLSRQQSHTLCAVCLAWRQGYVRASRRAKAASWSMR